MSQSELDKIHERFRNNWYKSSLKPDDNHGATFVLGGISILTVIAFLLFLSKVVLF